MPRKNHGTHPDHVRTSASKPAEASQNIDAPQAHPLPHVTPPTTPTSQQATLLATVLDRRDGWLRVVPDGDGKVVWWKWKFTTGHHAGFYVMVRGDVDQHSEALRVLARKLNDVDGGFARPTRDSYYDQG